MEVNATDADLCMRKFSKYFTGRAYTWYVNLKSGSVQEQEHLT